MEKIKLLKGKVNNIIGYIKATEKRRTIATAIITTLIILFGLLTVIYYISGPAKGYMTSDTTDSLEWAEEYRQSGSLVSDEYHYAAILPFGGNQIFLPFLAMFGYSMEAQVCGLITFAILLCAAIMYLLRSLDLGWIASASVTSGFMLLMSSSKKLREIMWEHIFYYNLGILFFCVGFALAIRILRDGPSLKLTKSAKIMKIARFLLFLLFCTLTAMDGLQAMACLSVPLIFAILFRCFLNNETPLFSRKNIWNGVIAGGVLIFSIIGMIILNAISGNVTADYAESYSTYSSLSNVVNNFLKQFVNWFELFGVNYLPGDELMSMDSVINIIRIAVSLVILITPWAMLTKYKKIESNAIKTVLLGHVGVSAFIVFACSFGNLGNVSWRLTPMLGTSIIVTALAGIEMAKRKGVIKRIGVVTLISMILCSFITFMDIAEMPSDYGKNNSWHSLAKELEARDLQYGYASFWWANSTKMISGEVHLACVSIRPSGITKDKYQSRKDSWDNKDTDEYFLVMTEQEYLSMGGWIQNQYSMGKIIDYFTVESTPYDIWGAKGTQVHVFVFSENLF